MGEIITHSAKETKNLSAKFAIQIISGQILLRQLGQRAVALALEGDLGAGKTTFLHGFAKGLGIKEKILSPTFIIMKKFKIPPNNKLKTLPRRGSLKTANFQFSYFYHIDCYRLKNKKDLENLGFRKIVLNPENIVAIEWPEKIFRVIPKNFLKIKFTHLKANKRGIILTKELDRVRL